VHSLQRFAAAALIALGAASCSEPAALPTSVELQTAETPAQGAKTSRERFIPPPTSTATTLTENGFGGLKIGMTVDQAAGALGRPLSPLYEETGPCQLYTSVALPEGVVVMTQSGRVSRITLSGPAEVATSEGFRIGDKESDLLTRFGALLDRETHHYLGEPAEYLTSWSPDRTRGVRYETDQNERVFEIHAGDETITNVEGCA
jgi:hypothetical protein